MSTPDAGRRVVVTGMGIVSCLGNTQADVTRALREGRSGIRHVPEYAELGLRSQVAGIPDIDLDAAIDRKQKRFMGDAAAYATVAMRDAMARADGPVLAFCRSGTRSCNLWALARAGLGDDPDALTGKARAAGYDLTALRPLMDAVAPGAA